MSTIRFKGGIFDGKRLEDRLGIVVEGSYLRIASSTDTADDRFYLVYSNLIARPSWHGPPIGVASLLYEASELEE